MGSEATDLLDKLFSVPEAERNDFLAGLAERLPSGTGDPFQSPEWQAELARRIDDVTSNPEMFEDWDVVERELLAKYPKR